MDDKNNYCTFYLVRHGESEGNVKGIIQGGLDSPLTDNGRIQAEDLNKKLKDVNFDAAYSSDLLRTKETAEILVAERKLAVVTSKLIRERSYGVYEGRKSEEFDSDVKKAMTELEVLTDKMNKSIWDFGDLKTVESKEQLISRMITFLREVAITHAGKNVLVVGHAGIFRNLMIHIGFAKREELIRGWMKNTAFIRLKSDGVYFFVEETYGITKSIGKPDRS